ncbi:MAG: hypothetical protein HY337_11295 [Gemmatimonadetes bacterium]|nr:hypothetical protein [Gemmatimonadota bacterium]
MIGLSLIVVLVVVVVVPAVVVTVVPRVVRSVVPSLMRALASEGRLDAGRSEGQGSELREVVDRLQQRVEELEERSDFLARMLTEVRREPLRPAVSGE